MSEAKRLLIVPSAGELYRCRALTAGARARCHNTGLVPDAPGGLDPVTLDRRCWFDGDPLTICPLHFRIYRQGAVLVKTRLSVALEIVGGPFDGDRADPFYQVNGQPIPVGGRVTWEPGTPITKTDAQLPAPGGATIFRHCYERRADGTLVHIAVE